MKDFKRKRSFRSVIENIREAQENGVELERLVSISYIIYRDVVITSLFFKRKKVRFL